MHAILGTLLMKEFQREREAQARSHHRLETTDKLVIRSASRRDQRRLRRLAELDSAPEPRGSVLVAEREGTLVAALPLAGGKAIADPFEWTADAVGLLELRRAQLRPAG